MAAKPESINVESRLGTNNDYLRISEMSEKKIEMGD